MLATPEIKRKKPILKTKAIHKIMVEDDILKIKYHNIQGGCDDVIFTNPRYPDLFDIEVFLLNIVPDDKMKKINEEILSKFGKSVCKQLSKIADPNDMGFGKLRNLKFGRFIIEQAFESSTVIN